MKKLLPSPSISSASFEPTICTWKSATAGCLAGIVRRILCSRSLPTHPSDYITRRSCSTSIEKHQGLDVEEKIEEEAKAAPGIVARLMGLDSIPEISQVKPNLISSSRSMNAMDYMQGSDQVQGKHKRVNSTMSFREIPTFLELEDENFLVLSFVKESEEGELREKQRKLRRKEEKNRTDKLFDSEGNNSSKKALCVLIKEEMNRRITKTSEQDFAKCLKIEDSICRSVPCKESKRVPTRKRKKKPNCSAVDTVENEHEHEHECSSEDSSPVSVLDFDQFITDQQVPKSDEDFKLEDSSRKLSAELEDCRESGIVMDNEGKIEETSEGKSPVLMRDSKDYLYFWDAICSLTESEVGNNSSWLKFNSNTWKHEEIAADFGLQILDQLLDELMVQLSGLP